MSQGEAIESVQKRADKAGHLSLEVTVFSCWGGSPMIIHVKTGADITLREVAAVFYC